MFLILFRHFLCNSNIKVLSDHFGDEYWKSKVWPWKVCELLLIFRPNEMFSYQLNRYFSDQQGH